MSRIRTIKPEFFTSEDIVSLTPLARLLYVALWCEADKEGRLVWKPRTFKMRYMPGDNCDIEALCKELTDAGLVRLYGDGLAYIPQFSRHQHVNPRESASVLPTPPGVSPSGPKKVGKTLREAVFERDGHACVRCRATDHLEVDHILPQSLEGPHILENLRTLCRKCNAARPVAGAALAEDLARDGFTVASLRAKFGIDASILDPHTQVGREGKGREVLDPAVPSKRASRLPDDWELPDDWAEWTRVEMGWVRADIASEACRFRDFWVAKPGKDGTKLDWQATWRNWCRNSRLPKTANHSNPAFEGAI